MSKASREREKLRNEKYGRNFSYGFAWERDLNLPKFDRSNKHEINELISLIKTKFPERCRSEFLEVVERFQNIGAKFYTLFVKVRNGKSIACVAYFIDLEEESPLGIYEYGN